MRLLILVIALFLISCRESYRNFNKLDANVHYKLLSYDEQQKKLSNSDYFELSFAFCESEKCDEETEIQKSFSSVSSTNSFWTGFSVKDELILILDSSITDYWLDLFQLKEKKLYWPVIIHLKISDCVEQNSPFDEINDSLYLYRERKEIEKMINDSASNFVKKGSCYIDEFTKGTGDTVLEGRNIALSYKAFFSNGRKFDDTDNWKDSIDIVYGQPYQLISGLESGIRSLREGSEAKIIIPSHLAFGKQGSSSGLVPPYEPLLYNVKILSVKQPSL